MGSLPSGVFKSRGEGTVQPASSLRAHITNLYRRADLAPAVPIIAGISFVVHVVFGNNYGYFRDELYFMAMSHHPAFGYVDVPPLVPWITLIPLFLIGNALWALHVISALVCAGIIILTGLMARLLGGTGWVQGLAALGSATSLALLVGLLLTVERRLLFTRWTLFGGLIALAIFSPFLLWNAANGWASFQYWAGYSANHSGGGTPIDFVANQIVINNPFLLPLWGSGLWYFFFSARGKRYRVFGWAYVILFVLFILLNGKSYFLSPAYPVLSTGGAMQWGRLRVRWPKWGPRWVAGYAVVLVLSFVLLAPAAMPVLPPTAYAHIYGPSGNSGAQQQSGDVYGFPQSLADRFGWPEQVALIAQVYYSLPPSEQRVACIFASNYGEAGALEQFGARYHLPPPISGHNAFYIWGPGGCTGQVLITINVAPQDAARAFGSVTLAARTSCKACVDFENNAPILILRDPKEPFSVLWAQAKMYE